MQIRYVKNPQTANFVVNLVAERQQIVVLPAAFIRITGVNPRAVLGSMGVTAAQAAELGFVIEMEVAV